MRHGLGKLCWRGVWKEKSMIWPHNGLRNRYVQVVCRRCPIESESTETVCCIAEARSRLNGHSDVTVDVNDAIAATQERGRGREEHRIAVVSGECVEALCQLAGEVAMDKALALPKHAVEATIIWQCAAFLAGIVAVGDRELNDGLPHLLLLPFVQSSLIIITTALRDACAAAAVIHGDYSTGIGGGADSAICHAQRHGRRWDANGGGIAAHPHVPGPGGMLGPCGTAAGRLPVRGGLPGSRRPSSR
mmetsp:Transcript_13615/g.39005  ORF Transcript_13615/g.39005 Transcript_13615/m.39005 type:complete len:247 (-) Transcript_13615:1620-2360(-)